MLDFLGNIGGIANTVSQIAGPVGQILDAVRGPQKLKKPVMEPRPESERYAISLLKAIADPGNSLIQSLASQELENLVGGMQTDIRSKVLADRRERSMGRSNVFFDPERMDENISNQITRGTPMLRQQAQSNAIQRILEAAGVGNYGQAESQRTQNFYRAQGEYEKAKSLQPNRMSRMQSGLGGVQDILKLFQPETIQRNQQRY